MPTTGDIATRIMASLRASEPDLDSATGTPLRKIIDAFSEALAEAYVDEHLITFQYDIDSKVEGDLDDFVALFGFARIPAQRAQGVVAFTRPEDDVSRQTASVIPIGAQIAAVTLPMVYIQTTVPAVMNPGQLSVEVPVQAMVAGPAGNIGAGLATTPVQNTQFTVVNVNPIVGGTAQESDSQLRERFKATVFRSLAGTQAMYDGIALEMPLDPQIPETRAIHRVNTIGSSRRWREQVQVIGGTATTTIKNAAYIFADNAFCGADIDGGSFLTPGVHFIFTPSNPNNRTNATAVLSSLSAAGMPDGLYDLEFEYVPQASRNDPGDTRFGDGGVNNRIDIWTDGLDLQQASQSVVFTTAKVFNTSSTTLLYNMRFTQDSDATPNPVSGAIFIPLAFGPVVSIPDSMTIGGVTYVEGTDYWIVHQNDCFGYTATSLFGLAWSASKRPANGTTFSIQYTWNRIAKRLQDAIMQWRLVGTDAKAHCGKAVSLRFNFAIVYDRRYDPIAVKTDIDKALGEFLGVLSFESAVQASDILQVVHNVPGVDNVRFLNSIDSATGHSMQAMSRFSSNTVLSTYQSGGRVIDVQLAADQYPIFHSCVAVQKAANSFGGI